MSTIVQNSADITGVLGLSYNGSSLAELAYKHVLQASRYLSGRVGSVVYSAAISEVDENHSELKQAEAMLCVAYALPFANLRISETGGLSKVIGLFAGESKEELLDAFQITKIVGFLRSYANELTQHLILTTSDTTQVVAGSIGMMEIKGDEDWL